MRRNYQTLVEQSPALRGLTLLEVVSGIALSAVLISTLILAHTEHAQQIQAANLRHHAVLALDAYLSLMIQDKTELIVGDCTDFEFNDYQWKVCTKDHGVRRTIAQTDYRIIRVEMFLEKDFRINKSQVITYVEMLQPSSTNN